MAATDPRDGLYAFEREISGVKPTIVTSKHTIDEMFDSLRNRTKVIAHGLDAPRVNFTDWKSAPSRNEERSRYEQPATVVMAEMKHEFIVSSITAVNRGHGSLPDFLIHGTMQYEEYGNYYGTNRWSTETNLKYFASDDRFEFVWDQTP